MENYSLYRFFDDSWWRQINSISFSFPSLADPVTSITWLLIRIQFKLTSTLVFWTSLQTLDFLRSSVEEAETLIIQFEVTFIFGSFAPQFDQTAAILDVLQVLGSWNETTIMKIYLALRQFKTQYFQKQTVNVRVHFGSHRLLETCNEPHRIRWHAYKQLICIITLRAIVPLNFHDSAHLWRLTSRHFPQHL